ncbi:SDR family oxidoreductase [Candidatus Obscuribacterales bacterium]|nr:SDR family oxidoreductase [Candidatus Obscuribacterales bacterium]
MGIEQRKRTALVTGGAGGIGFELCKLIAADGYDLVLVDMNEMGLNRAARQLETEFGVNVQTICKDLSDPKAPGEIVNELNQRCVETDLLVNNAGFGLSGSFVDIALEPQLNMIQVNIGAVISLTRLLLPGMLKRDGVAILNVASIAAFQPGPYMAAYFASKAFVLSWSEGLAKELEGSSVSVTALCPPPTNTGFAARANSGTSFAFQKRAMATPEEVARDAWRGVKNKKVIVLPTMMNKLAVFSSRFLPRKTVTAVAGLMNKQRTATAVPNTTRARHTSEFAISKAG